MVQIIYFLMIIKLFLCFQYENTYEFYTDTNLLMARLEFETEFESIKTWTVSRADVSHVVLGEAMCYINKIEANIVCYCDTTGSNVFGKCISPLFVLDSIHKFGFQSNPRHPTIDEFTKDVDFEQNIRPTVMKAIKLVLNTFYSRSCNYNLTGEGTNTSRIVCFEFIGSNGCKMKGYYEKKKIHLETTNLKIQKFPQYALQKYGSILRFSLHEPLRGDYGELYFLLGILPFQFYGDRKTFWCADSNRSYEQCNDSELVRRFKCSIKGLGIIPYKFEPVVNYSTNSAEDIKHPDRSNEFRIETIYEMILFLVLFVIPIIALCVYSSIPEKVDNTPLDPLKFSETSEIQELSRRFENVESAKNT